VYVFRIPLSCNYIAVKCRNSGVYQYAVAFNPEVDSLPVRKKLVLGEDATRAVIGNVRSFDGRMLFLPVQLQNLVL